MNFTLNAAQGSILGVRLSTRDNGCTGAVATQDFYVPYTSATGATQNIVVPFSHFGISNTTNVVSVAFAAFSNNATYKIGPITLLGGLGPQSTSPPSAGTTLDMPDPKFGNGSGSNGAQWAYDSGSYAGQYSVTSTTQGAQIAQQYMTAGVNQWSNTWSTTNRPYAVSGKSGSGGSAVGDGDQFKIYSLATFGAGTYTWCVYTPLNVNGVAGERNSTAAWLLCESCNVSHPPEIDIECGYSDASDGSGGIRGDVGANANQTVCQFTVIDDTDGGTMATSMPVEGNAWHLMQIKLWDDGQGYYNVAFIIDGNTATWPNDISTHSVYYDTVEASASAKSGTGGYKSATLKFNAMYSMEHYNWMASTNALTYNTSYFDWFNFQP